MLEEFQKIGRYLFQEGLIWSHGGNLSVRRGDKIIITRSGAMLADLKESDLVEVGFEPAEGDKLASVSLPVHRSIYRETKAEAIIQANPSHAIAVSLTDNRIVPQDTDGLQLYKSAAIVRVHQPIGSDEAARLIPSFLQGTSTVAVVKGYGSFAIGKNLEEAYKYTSLLENSCKILIALRSSGGARPPEQKEKRDQHQQRRSAIPPGIGVMDRSRYKR